MIQPPYGIGTHDSVQYHFFLGDWFLAVRLFRTASLDHSSAWLFDGGVHELAIDSRGVAQSNGNHLEVSAPGFELSAADDEGVLRIGRADVELTFSPRTTTRWEFPSGVAGLRNEEVIHQPNLECTMKYRGRTGGGAGYCKRYYFMKPPRCVTYQFLHAVSDDRSFILMSADGLWGNSKYDYFKIVQQDGRMIEALPSDSYHQASVVYGTIDGRRYEVGLTELGRWETMLASPSMDTQLLQQYCRMTVRSDDATMGGVALKETCLGTVG